MSKEDLEFPGEPIVRGKDPSALEFPEVPRAQTRGVKHDLVFPEVPRAQTGGVKHDLVFPEGEEAREAQSAQVDTKGKEAQKLGARAKESQEQCALTRTHSGTETLEERLESSEERRKSGSPLCASPRPGRVFAFRALTAVAVVALVGLVVAAVRPLDGRLLAVLVASALAAASVVAGVVACGGR